MVNQQTLEGQWTGIKGRIQETWGHISDNDLQKVKGDVKQLVGLIQQKSGEAREQVEAKLEEFATHTSNLAQQAREQVQEGYEQAEQMVRQRPVESVAIAFGSGLIAGVIVGLVLRSR